ncbi:hypothetical protein GCM10023317_58660 [Actinopolymorpha pittospori]
MLHVGPSDRQTVQKPPAVPAPRVSLRLVETLELTLASPNLSLEPLDPVGHRHRVMPSPRRRGRRPGRRPRPRGALLVLDAGIDVRTDPLGVPLCPPLRVMTDQNRLTKGGCDRRFQR